MDSTQPLAFYRAHEAPCPCCRHNNLTSYDGGLRKEEGASLPDHYMFVHERDPKLSWTATFSISQCTSAARGFIRSWWPSCLESGKCSPVLISLLALTLKYCRSEGSYAPMPYTLSTRGDRPLRVSPSASALHRSTSTFLAKGRSIQGPSRCSRLPKLCRQ